MAHDNPIHSRPLSEEGRENYDRIFRKPRECSPPSLQAEWLEKQEQRGKEALREMERSLINQKQIDTSA